MKAMYLLDQTCNIENAPDIYRAVAVPIFTAAGHIKEWRIPKGTIVEGGEALLRVRTGQAMPIDEECATACGLTAAELQRNQRSYLAAEAGIRGKKDYEMFMAGVIDGYGKNSTDEKPEYIPGRNWAAFQKAKADVANEQTKDI